LLFVNSILYLLSFLVFLLFFLMPNINLEEDGGIKSLFLFMIPEPFLQLIFFSFDSFKNFLMWIFFFVIPTFCLVTSFIYIIHIMLSLKKEKMIKSSKILFYQISYLLLNVIVFLCDIQFYADIVINKLLSLYMLLPVIIFAIYNLVSTIVYINKMKKKETIETR